MSGSWSNSVTTSLTLPTGATTGARIVLDGTSDTILIYDAGGHLVESIASAAGFDPYGNNFLAGYTTYDRSGSGLFMNYNGSSILMGNLVSGQPVVNPTTGTLQNGGSNYSLVTPALGAFTDQVNVNFSSGEAGAASGSGLNTLVALTDQQQTQPVDLYLSGNVFRTELNGQRDIWQVPSMATGYTNVSMQYRRDERDSVIWDGEITQNTGVASAGAATVINAVPAAYRPAAVGITPCAWFSSAGVLKGAAAFAFNATGTVSLFWPAATANGDRFYITGVAKPLGNVYTS